MAFGAKELEEYLVTHGISGKPADYIRGSAAGLSRDLLPTGRHASCVVEMQSTKMGVTVNTESRTAEFVYALQLEFDDSIVAYFEQPPMVDVSRHTKRGYRRTTTYHPDFLLLRVDGPQVVQVKPLAKLEELIQTNKDWTKLPDGTFQDLPAQEALATRGLVHVVAAIDDSDKQRAANIALMRRSLAGPSVDTGLSNRAAKYLEEHSLLPLAELASELGQQDYTPFIRLIAEYRLFTDLGRYSLAHPDTCLVARDRTMLDQSYVMAWHELKRDQGNLRGAGAQYDLPLERHLSKGRAALEALAAGRNDRTTRRWRAKIRAGEAQGVCPLVALSRDFMKRGNRNPKRPEQVAFATDYIKAKWASDANPSPRALYRRFKSAAEEELSDSKPLSDSSFYKLLDRLKDSLARDRGGNRMGNAAQMPTAVADRALRAQRPFELATCDHYLCDQYCIIQSANGFEYAMRPWLTVLRDVATDEVLAFWLRLGAPSKRSVSLVLRQCVRTHGRLPETIIVDNGSEFRSVYLSALAAHCGFNLMFRPVGHPRYGSEAERFFGQYKELWLSARSGNLVSLKEVRAVSASHRPEKLATMSLLDIWQDLLEFNNWMSHRVTGAELSCPATRMRNGMAAFSCSGIPTAYDDNFVIASAVDVGEYKLDRHRGLHIGPLHYWTPELASETKPRLEVRDDPQDPYRVYALTHDVWTTCLASPAPSYSKLTPLQQIVEGVLQLDRSEFNKAVCDDADRLLVQAIERREAAQPMPLQAPQCVEGPPAETDFFDATDSGALPELVEATW